MSAPIWIIPIGIIGLAIAALVVLVLLIERDARRAAGDALDFGRDIDPLPRSERKERLARRNVSRDARRVIDP